MKYNNKINSCIKLIFEAKLTLFELKDTLWLYTIILLFTSLYYLNYSFKHF